MQGLAALAAAPTTTRTINEWDVPWDRSVLAGGSVNEVTAFNLSTVWACETLITDSIASLPVDTYRKTSEGREETTPPGWVEHPNPEMGRIDYDTQRVLSLLGWGNAYSLLVRQGGSTDPRAPVVQRWVADPWRVRPFRDHGELYYDVNGKTYLPSQVQHVRGYVRPGELVGMSVIENARRSLGIATSAEIAGKSLYDQGMLQSGVLSVPQMPAETSRDVVERIREQVVTYNGGSHNAGKPLVLTGGTTWMGNMFTPTDAQYLETRKFQVQEIARWFRVPPHMVGDVERSTSWGTGIEQQTLGFAKYTLQPWITRLEAADSALLPGSQFLRFNLNAFVRADLLTRYRAYALARAGGWSSANDIRDKEDEPRIDGGDVYLAPLNMADLELFEASVPAQKPGGGPDAGDASNE